MWNGPRNGYWSRNSETGKNEKPEVQSVSATFESKDVYGARLYWEDQLWEVAPSSSLTLPSLLYLLSLRNCLRGDRSR